MKNRKAVKMMAALLTGAMLLAAPSVAMADTLYDSTHYDANASIPQVQNLSVVWEKGTPYLTWTPVQLKESQYVMIEYSESADFPDDDTTSYYGWYDSSDGNKVSVYGSAGKTYYYRACIRDYAAEKPNTYTTYFGPYSNVVEFTKEVPEVSVSDRQATSSSVYFRFTNMSSLTGVEIYRATGSGSYKKVATTTDSDYTDKNLKSAQTYKYKLRGYVYNEKTQKTNYGEYTYLSVTTWGNDLKLKATPTGTKTVKLTWKRVSGATGYKIYRTEGTSYDSTTEDGLTSSYSNWQLVKTVKGYKTNSYTNKKLTPGQTYSFKVVAYKNVKKNGKTTRTINIVDTDSATLDFGSFDYTEVENANGSVTLKWKKMIGAEGYKVEQQHKTKSAEGYTSTEYTEITTLPATATSYTCAAVTDTANWDTGYRIYAYNGNKISSYINVYTENATQKVDKVAGITATPNAELTGITVSWQPVAGAAYYRVYRSRQLTSYNADRDTYSNGGGTYLQTLQKDGVLVTDAVGTYYTTYPTYTDKITGNQVVDTYLSYPVKEYGYFNPKTNQDDPDTVTVNDVQKAPLQGVRYYYYVQAYAPDGKPIEEGDEQGYISSSTYSKPATAMLNSVTLSKPSIKSVAAGKKKATVSWKKVTGAQKYYVYYSTKKNSGYTYAGITTKTKLVVSGLTSRKTYYFKVKACTSNAAGGDVYSAMSSAKSKKVK